MQKFRGFISLDIGSFPKLLEFENEIKKTGANIKLVESHNVHITLKFLGETEEKHIEPIEKIIKDAVKDIEPFNIQLKGAGVFPNERYIKVMWIGIKNGEKIGEIAKKIDPETCKLGFERDKRGFSPHLTIARVKTAKNKDKLLKIVEKNRDFEFANITVDTIKLKKSELTPKGPIYTTLKEISL